MKNVEETWGTFHITVNKIGRKWVHVTIPRSNGYKLEATLDTFNAYGGGIIIRYTEDTVWLIINNGGDGDAWGTNNLRTGGAGAYAFRTSLESVKDILQTFLERKKV